MRIVGGRHRGRQLAAPAGLTARPTADRAREALFNILTHRVAWPELRVLDAFAGTGALGFEALSRGAAQVTFLETAADSLAALRANARTLREEERCAILAQDATKPPKATAPCGLVLMDPPYGKELAPPCLTALHAQGWMAEDTVIVVEVGAKEPFTPPPDFVVEDERRYGAAKLVILGLA